MLIMGSMIGSGIFIVPAAMSRDLGSPLMLLLAWVVTAILTFLAALCYGELAAMMPKAGGQYVYLREAYGPMFGFLYGWTLFAVIQTGTIAAVAVAFAKFSGVFFQAVSAENILFHLGSIKVTTQQLLAIAGGGEVRFAVVRSVVFVGGGAGGHDRRRGRSRRCRRAAGRRGYHRLGLCLARAAGGAVSVTPVMTGGCQCGAVRYALNAQPEGSFCHCRMCQRASGGPFGVRTSTGRMQATTIPATNHNRWPSSCSKGP